MKTFKYHNGTENVQGDPRVLLRRLDKALGPVPDAVFEGMKSADPGVRAAQEEVFFGAVREAFSLVPLDPKTGTGATEDDALAVYEAFVTYLQKKSLSTAN